MNGQLLAYKEAARDLAEEFFIYMNWDEEFDPDTDMDQVAYTSSMWECWDRFWGIDEMEQILENHYDPGICDEWYDYNLWCDENYKLSLKAYTRIREQYTKEFDLTEWPIWFQEWYKNKSDAQKAYRESPEGIAQDKKDMEEIRDMLTKQYFPNWI